MNSRRQNQISSEIRKAFSEVLTKDVQHLFPANVLISVVQVKVTSDLSIAKIYLSIFNSDNTKELMENFEENYSELRGYLGRRMKSLRRIPNLEFYEDDTMMRAEKLDNIFKDLNEENIEDEI